MAPAAFPKGMDLRVRPDEHLSSVANQLNRRATRNPGVGGPLGQLAGLTSPLTDSQTPATVAEIRRSHKFRPSPTPPLRIRHGLEDNFGDLPRQTPTGAEMWAQHLANTSGAKCSPRTPLPQRIGRQTDAAGYACCADDLEMEPVVLRLGESPLATNLFRGTAMKVVHLMGPLRPSGMERMFLSASKALRDAGIESIIVGQGNSHSFAPQLESAEYRVEAIEPLKRPAGAKDWATLLRRERPDVIHIHTEGAFAPAVLTAKLALPKAPIIRTVHNVFEPFGKARLSRVAQGALADRFVKTFIAVSPDVQANERRFGRNAQLIFNWVDDRFYEIRSQRKPLPASAVIVGNPSPIKNHVVALRACEAGGLDLYFHGDESGASKEEVSILNRLEQSGKLRHRGTGDPAPSLQAGSVFLMPSKHEGMPIALSEALVAGLPAIINDAPGMQWARQFPNVTMLSGGQELWDKAVLSVPKNRSHTGPLPLDLSAERGAKEYAQLYASLS